MIPTYRCLSKIKDSHDVAKQFVLQDLQTKKQYTVEKDELKTKLSLNQVRVTNLQMDSQGRLVDKQEATVKQHQNSQSQSRILSDMTNKELKEFIESLSRLDRQSSAQIFRILREIVNRCGILDGNISELSSDIQQLQLSVPEQISSDPVSQIQAIQNYLLDNQSELGQIKTDIQSLSDQIANLNMQSTTENSSSENTTTTRNIISTAGKFDVPNNEYDKYWCNMYFSPEVTMDDIGTQLSNFDNSFSDISLAPDIIDRLKEQIALTSDAYYRTEEFYNAQLDDYKSNIRGSQILALATDAASGTFKQVANVSPEVAKNIGKEALNNFLKLIPFKEADAKYDQAMGDFKNRDDLSKEQANKLMTEVGGIWNCAVEFIANNPEWEVMLYVIQTMNFIHLKTYKVGDNFKPDTVVNDKGTMKAYMDNSLLDRNANKLTEYSLKNYFERMEKRSVVQDKQYEYLKKTYDRFIISYFAAKKLLYENQCYPFSDITTKEINGAVVVLTHIGLYLSNVSSNVACCYIESFISDNNNRRKQQYTIKIPTDLIRYVS